MGIVLQQSFSLITCYKCGCPFAVPDHFQAKRKEDGQFFYCPNGHSQSYCKSTADILRAQLEEKQRLLDQSRNREAVALEEIKKGERARKKLAKRLDAGVCPVDGCKRHFTNLQRHIQTEHAGASLAEAPQQKQIAGPVQ